MEQNNSNRKKKSRGIEKPQTVVIEFVSLNIIWMWNFQSAKNVRDPQSVCSSACAYMDALICMCLVLPNQISHSSLLILIWWTCSKSGNALSSSEGFSNVDSSSSVFAWIWHGCVGGGCEWCTIIHFHCNLTCTIYPNLLANNMQMDTNYTCLQPTQWICTTHTHCVPCSPFLLFGRKQIRSPTN